jgi:hypothetical protein
VAGNRNGSDIVRASVWTTNARGRAAGFFRAAIGGVTAALVRVPLGI